MWTLFSARPTVNIDAQVSGTQICTFDIPVKGK